MIEISDADAVLIARAIRYADSIPGLSAAYGRLVDAIAARRWTADLEPAPHPPRPQWRNVAPAVQAVERRLRADPGSLSLADAIGAYTRDTFDELGLSVHDEDTLYVALTTAALLGQFARNAYRSGALDAAVLVRVLHLNESFTAGLVDYLPAEARGR